MQTQKKNSKFSVTAHRYTPSSTLQEVLSYALQAEGIDACPSSFERYRGFLLRFAERYGGDSGTRARNALVLTQTFLAASGSIIGAILVRTQAPNETAYAILAAHLVLVAVVQFSVHLIPKDIQELKREISELRLMNVAEHLAAQIALLGLSDDGSGYGVDDTKRIEQISAIIPEFHELKPDITQKARACLDVTSVFEDVRDTNISLGNLKLEAAAQDRLLHAAQQLVELCTYLFGGGSFTVKIYLRGSKILDGKEVELLASVAKYPHMPGSPYGSSWLRARGNPSLVWRCLDLGKPERQDVRGYKLYYKDVLAVPIPGRIGVIALTSDREDTFNDENKHQTAKALRIAARALIVNALDGE